jgi:hypothetical protein
LTGGRFTLLAYVRGFSREEGVKRCTMGMSVSRRRGETQDDKTVYVAGEGG